MLTHVPEMRPCTTFMAKFLHKAYPHMLFTVYTMSKRPTGSDCALSLISSQEGVLLQILEDAFSLGKVPSSRALVGARRAVDLFSSCLYGLRSLCLHRLHPAAPLYNFSFSLLVI